MLLVLLVFLAFLFFVVCFILASWHLYDRLSLWSLVPVSVSALLFLSLVSNHTHTSNTTHQTHTHDHTPELD
jgi:hypothetical protein